MEIRKIITLLFFLVSAIMCYSQWSSKQKPLWTEGMEEFQMCDVKNGKVLFLSQRLAQVMGQGTMFESKVSRLHEYDVFSGKETTLFPKDWNFPESFACYGKSENEVFYESRILANGTLGRWAKIHVYKKGEDKQFGQRLKLMNFDQEGFDCQHPVYIDNLNMLIFSSNRPGGSGGFDLYGSYRMDSIWSPVFSLGSEVNTPSNEQFPEVIGNDLIFIRTSDNGNSSCFKVPLNTQFNGVMNFPEFNEFDRVVPFSSNQIYTEKKAIDEWFEQVQKKETYSLQVSNQTGKLAQVVVRIERNEGFEVFELTTNEKGFTDPFQFSSNEKVKISLQGNWQSLQMPIYATLYSSKWNQIRRYKFNSSGVIQLELLDFIFSKMNFLNLRDDSQLIECSVPSKVQNKLIYYFKKNEWNIDELGNNQIKEWIKEVNPNGVSGTYKITSYSSGEGKRERNKKLAQQRLSTGRESLLTFGVSPLQIQMQIGGIEEKSEGGRRVEIEFIPLQQQLD